MKIKLIALLCASAMIFSLPGCMTLSASDNLTEDIKAQTVDTDGASLDDGAAAASAFAMKVFSLALESEDENIVISPLSAYLALAMTANGAKGDTLLEFTKMLGGDLDMAGINLFCRSLINRLTQKAGNTTLSIADSIWFDKNNFSADKDFLQAAVDYFDAEAFASDFAAAKAVNDVNKWIEKNTNGLIKDMLDRISPDTVMLLINTLYMKSKWASAFEAIDNYEGSFTKADGTQVDTVYMSKTERMKYVESSAAEGVLLPYDDERLGFVALMPKEGKSITDTLESLDIKSLTGGATNTEIRLMLPKFKIEYKVTMNDILKSAGISTAFNPMAADLSGLGTSGGNLYIGEVLQKVVIEVNEEGTEAAAATVIDVRTTSVPGYDLSLSFDKPFIYMVVDLESGIPLFIGQMDDPS